ncbi:hypothetical protein VPH35_081864 [Triticum aestivum]|nr:uncharacterized protein LOC123106684 [Triticum aestivum]
MAFVETNPVEKTMKANEIMARFRRIAPKPVLASPPTAAVDQSQQRRSGKRGARDLVPAPADKRLRGAPCYPFPPYRALPWTSPLEATPVASSRCLFPGDRDGDLLRKPQAPKVIVPRPARPVRTTICVDASSVTGANSVKLPACRMTAEQLEAEIERDALPAVISGPGDRVIRANDAYKALVGQPVCPWLDSVPDDSCAGASRRINGEVVLDVRWFTSTETIRSSAGGTFSCSSRISWERNGTLTSVAMPCDVMRFDCGSGDHRFVWRFDTYRISKGTVKTEN